MIKTMKYVKNAYTAHIFNHMNSDLVVMKQDNAAYALLAKEFCPDMYYSKGGVLGINECF